MKELSRRTEGFTDSVIRRMTRVANQYGAINLSQGFPDFDPPKAITDRLAEVAGCGPHQYALTWGAQNFREALARKHEHFSGMKVDPNKEIVVTCGSTEAMMASMLSVCNPGDKVVVFSPFYENYGADAILSNATPIYVPLKPPTFDFDANELEDAMKQDGVKALILCNPSNPCGKVFTKDELMLIADLAKKYDIYVIADERIIERVKKVHDFLTVGAAAPLMEAAVVGLNFPDAYYKELQAHYTHMKNLFVGGLRDLGLKFTEPQGAYYVLLDISEFGYKNDEEFCIAMAEKVGVAAVPGSSFFKEDVNHLIRFHYAKKDETLKAALDRLADLQKIRK